MVEATLPNGRRVESDALCSRSEKGKNNVSDHTIITTAKTRATNRAIAELIGAGEVSSEEMNSEFRHQDTVDIPVGVVEEKPQPETPMRPQTAEDVEEIPVMNPEYIHKEAPRLVSECIDALIERGGSITTKSVLMCIESRCQNTQEYEECKKFLEDMSL